MIIKNTGRISSDGEMLAESEHAENSSDGEEVSGD